MSWYLLWKYCVSPYYSTQSIVSTRWLNCSFILKVIAGSAVTGGSCRLDSVSSVTPPPPLRFAIVCAELGGGSRGVGDGQTDFTARLVLRRLPSPCRRGDPGWDQLHVVSERPAPKLVLRVAPPRSRSGVRSPLPTRNASPSVSREQPLCPRSCVQAVAAAGGLEVPEGLEGSCCSDSFRGHPQ